MKHTYQITGVTCTGCETKVKNSLFRIPGINGLEIARSDQTITIEMEKHIPLLTLQKALDSKYQLSLLSDTSTSSEGANWVLTYKPILLIFAYITAISFISATRKGEFNWMVWMNSFMAGFFLVFSFFKMLNINGFAESYSMYDIVAKKIPIWGVVYVFIELLLGVGYAIHFDPIILNTITLVIMSVSIIGVIQSVFNRRKIQCACLGAVFNLPMSTITVIEDGIMIIMSIIMLYMLI